MTRTVMDSHSISLVSRSSIWVFRDTSHPPSSSQTTVSCLSIGQRGLCSRCPMHKQLEEGKRAACSIIGGRSSSHVVTSNRPCVALGCPGFAESVLAAAVWTGQRAAQSDEPAEDCHPASTGERDRLPEEERHIGRLLHRRPEWQHVGAHQQEGGPGKASVPHGKRLRAPVSRIEDARREERAEPEAGG